MSEATVCTVEIGGWKREYHLYTTTGPKSFDVAGVITLYNIRTEGGPEDGLMERSILIDAQQIPYQGEPGKRAGFDFRLTPSNHLSQLEVRDQLIWRLLK